MPTFITRLDLIGGKTLELGRKWLSDDPYPVGLIIERPETAVQFGGAEEDDDADDERVERTPAHYEVWLLPEKLRYELFEFWGGANAFFKGLTVQKPSTDEMKKQIEATSNVICRRVLISVVAFVEEVVGMQDARPVIHEYFADKIDMPDVADDEDKPAAVPGAAPSPQLNGPAASATTE
jgi:hypothetical protein